MRRFLPVLLAGLATAGTASEPDLKDAAHGFWLTENKRAIVEFAPCSDQNADETCGTLVWVSEPVGADGALKRDTKNRIADLKGRPLCGLPLIGGLHRLGDGELADGWLYSPRDGATYSADITLLSEGALRVHGYLLVPLFGRSQTWTRVEDAREG